MKFENASLLLKADLVTNLRKAHTLYMNRQQDHERAHELALKTDGEKQEKRRKAEEEAMHKVIQFKLVDLFRLNKWLMEFYRFILTFISYHQI